MKWKTYHRLIISTGQQEVLPFTFAHLKEAGYPQDSYLLQNGIDEHIALWLINRWNHGSSNLKYWVY
jgi:hypothetical protein